MHDVNVGDPRGPRLHVQPLLAVGVPVLDVELVAVLSRGESVPKGGLTRDGWEYPAVVSRNICMCGLTRAGGWLATRTGQQLQGA